VWGFIGKVRTARTTTSNGQLGPEQLAAAVEL
jgi:hypothetical protein